MDDVGIAGTEAGDISNCGAFAEGNYGGRIKYVRYDVQDQLYLMFLHVGIYDWKSMCQKSVSNEDIYKALSRLGWKNEESCLIRS